MRKSNMEVNLASSGYHQLLQIVLDNIPHDL